MQDLATCIVATCMLQVNFQLSYQLKEAQSTELHCLWDTCIKKQGCYKVLYQDGNYIRLLHCCSDKIGRAVSYFESSWSTENGNKTIWGYVKAESSLRLSHCWLLTSTDSRKHLTSVTVNRLKKELQWSNRPWMNNWFLHWRKSILWQFDEKHFWSLHAWVTDWISMFGFWKRNQSVVQTSVWKLTSLAWNISWMVLVSRSLHAWTLSLLESQYYSDQDVKPAKLQEQL